MGEVAPLVPAGMYEQNALPSHHHTHTPILPQAVIKTGILAPNDPVDGESQGVSFAQCVTFRERKRDTQGEKRSGGRRSWYWMKFKCQEKKKEE